jgi:hypothetical protein
MRKRHGFKHRAWLAQLLRCPARGLPQGVRKRIAIGNIDALRDDIIFVVAAQSGQPRSPRTSTTARGCGPRLRKSPATTTKSGAWLSMSAATARNATALE